MRRIAGLLPIAAPSVAAGDLPKFEVASVKPSDPTGVACTAKFGGRDYPIKGDAGTTENKQRGMTAKFVIVRQ